MTDPTENRDKQPARLQVFISVTLKPILYPGRLPDHAFATNKSCFDRSYVCHPNQEAIY